MHVRLQSRGELPAFSTLFLITWLDRENLCRFYKSGFYKKVQRMNVLPWLCNDFFVWRQWLKNPVYTRIKSIFRDKTWWAPKTSKSFSGEQKTELEIFFTGSGTDRYAHFLLFVKAMLCASSYVCGDPCEQYFSSSKQNNKTNIYWALMICQAQNPLMKLDRILFWVSLVIIQWTLQQPLQ